MRILFGAFAQGHGHFSKAAVLVPILEARGHDVRVVSSGRTEPPRGYEFTWHRHFPGFAYELRNGKADAKKTLLRWGKQFPAFVRNLIGLRRLVREWRPDVILSDFEPLSASALLDPGCEVIALSRQVTLLEKSIELPSGKGLEKPLTKATTRLFTAGATQRFGYHYAPETPRCVPPIIRDAFTHVTPSRGDFLLAYNHYHFTDGGTPDELIGWANRNAVEVKAYGFPQVSRGRQGRVWFCPADRAQWPRDLAACRAVLMTSGFNAPVEAFRVSKPLGLVPVPGNWEQKVNAIQLDEHDVGVHLSTWDYSAVLDREPPATKHPLRDWLSATPDEVIATILGLPTETPVFSEAA